MNNLLKKWIFIAQLQSPAGSGFRIRIRIQPGSLNPDPPLYKKSYPGVSECPQPPSSRILFRATKEYEDDVRANLSAHLRRTRGVCTRQFVQAN